MKRSAPTFGDLARRIRSRTTDLLAVTLILAGGLVLGSRLVRWWSTDESEFASQPVAASNAAWGADGSAVSLEFGDSPFQLERQKVTGDRDAAISRLVERCSAAARETPTVATELLPAEQRLLGQLDHLTPVRKSRGKWSVYHVPLPIELVVATRIDQAQVSRQSADRPGRRVVCWGLAQPAREGEWVLFLMRPAGGELDRRPESGRVALPEGSHRILALHEAAGGSLLAFEGEAEAGKWIAWFDDWFGRRNWKASAEWVRSPAGWSAQFAPKMNNEMGRIDVSFSRSGDGRLSGIVSVAPPPQEPSLKTTEEGSE